MGVAFSDGPIVYTTLRSHTAADMLADLDAVLGNCDWTRTSITGGYQYSLQSPQGFTAKCQITDSGAGYLIVQFLSTDETLAGFAHRLRYGVSNYESNGYQIVANQCQLFVSLKGITTQLLQVFGGRNYSVAGGIPYVPDTSGPCAASDGSDALVSQIFWSCGNSQFNSDFRNSRLCSNSYSYCLNGAMFVQPSLEDMVNPDNAYTAGLRLFPLTPTEDVERWFITPPPILKWSSGQPLNLDAYIGWGHQIRGQIWDAFQVSRDEPLDSIMTTAEISASGTPVSARWIAWNRDVPVKGGGGTYFATLYLLIDDLAGGGGAGTVCNYAY